MLSEDIDEWNIQKHWKYEKWQKFKKISLKINRFYEKLWRLKALFVLITF